MPGKTERARELENLYHARKRILIDDYTSDSDAIDEEMRQNLEMTATILRVRNFSRPKTYRNKGFDADQAFQSWLTDMRFVTFAHMSRSSFEYIFQMIRDDTIFVNPSFASPSRQRSVYFQLFVALTRLTADGDGGCINRVCELFNIGHGTIIKYTERVCAAMVRHVDRWVRWPDETARKALSALGQAKYGFPGFVASCDGTMIGIRRAPVFLQYPEAYHHHRHNGYGFNVLFWVDHHGSILRFTCNWPASAADQTIFNASHFAQNPWTYLKKDEEFIFVDLGFKRETFAVPPYKGKEAKLKHNAEFNFAQRRGRVKVEHVNGCIKARFASLKKIPINVKHENDHARCAAWITTCVMMHNILLFLRDEFEYEAVDAGVDAGDVAEEEMAAATAKVFQNAVRDRWLRDVAGWE